MFWWDQAADLTRAGRLERFGLITTNSLRQPFSGRVLDHHLTNKEPLSLIFAIPDHPWVDSADGAAVRISMTVGVRGSVSGVLADVTDEFPDSDHTAKVTLRITSGHILPYLTIGVDIKSALPLAANSNLSNRGVALFGQGFKVTQEEAVTLGLARTPGLDKHIRRYLNGRGITGVIQEVMVIDLFGVTLEEVQAKYPEVFQWILVNIKPERDQNRRPVRREHWWIFGEPNPKLRNMLQGLHRYIATPATAKHRLFVLLSAEVLPDDAIVVIAHRDAFVLGVLSSRLHLVWALAAGGTLESRPRYNQSRCFEPFPFPAATDEQQARIRAIAEALDSHRKRQQAQHPKLTLTGMYNVLEKLRSGEALNKAEKVVHEQGLVSVLRQLHDELDAAVFDAYGWPPALTDEEILERLVALNAERAAEEAQGRVRWLRPEYQAHPDHEDLRGFGNLEGLAYMSREATDEAQPTALALLPWPARMAEQAQAVRAALTALAGPASAAQVAAAFAAAPPDRVAELLETLVTLGLARQTVEGLFVAG